MMQFAAFEEQGFVVLPDILGPKQCESLVGSMTRLSESARESSKQVAGGIRNLLEISDAARGLSESTTIRALVTPILGAEAFAVRGILFDKTPAANWKVPWHQDLTIAVREQRESQGFGPWTTKAGVLHVQPPVAILEQMLSVRIHIDPCGAENGPLRVLPGTHRLGRVDVPSIQRLRKQTSGIACLSNAGGVVLMRPLLLHASSSAESADHRRVIHIDFASMPLPDGLQWRSSCGSGNG